MSASDDAQEAAGMQTIYDQAVRSIEAGKADDQLQKLQNAIRNRYEARKEEVLSLVHEVFGEQAEIVVQKVASTASGKVKGNVFVEKAAQKGGAEPLEVLSGPYKIDPSDGNTYRLSDAQDESRDGDVTITDIFGGHVHTVSKNEWALWSEMVPDEEPDDSPSGEEILSELDETERAMMNAEPKIDPGNIERRGAMISGLHSSDIGD